MNLKLTLPATIDNEELDSTTIDPYDVHWWSVSHMILEISNNIS